MSDHSELKRLAEAFPADLDFDSNTEPFFNGPSGESLGGGSTGFYSVYGKPFLIEGDDYEYDGPTYVEACNADFAKFMVAAREGVLALIAESERYLKLVERMVDQYVPLTELEGVPGWSRVVELVEVVAERDRLKTEVEGMRAQHGRDSAELRSLCQARDDARKERDQLKAEVERLTADNTSLRGSCAKLGAEHAGMVRQIKKLKGAKP